MVIQHYTLTQFTSRTKTPLCADKLGLHSDSLCQYAGFLLNIFSCKFNLYLLYKWSVPHWLFMGSPQPELILMQHFYWIPHKYAWICFYYFYYYSGFQWGVLCPTMACMLFLRLFLHGMKKHLGQTLNQSLYSSSVKLSQ